MKLFQQLLVAPAALGLMSPVATIAAELNPSVSDYSDSIEEVKSISDFSDVYPTDWAFQALTNLADRHGCVASTPSGPMTRYEAAAILNSCIGNVAQVNEEERRLLNEFGPELAVLKGRVDSLEARVGEFEAGVFSTTTKLTGKTVFNIGAVDRDYSSDATSAYTDNDQDAVTFSYDQQLNLNTSFTGEDLLYTRIKSGNGDADTWGSSAYGTYLASHKNSSTYLVDKMWYQLPVGDNFQAWIGPKIENYYMLASAPSIYRPVFKAFALGGNGLTYGASTGAGFGAAWTQEVDDRSQPRFAVSVNHVSKSGENADASSGGMLTGADYGISLVKLEYGSPQWQASVAYAKKGKNVGAASYFATKDGGERTGDTEAIALRGYWQPEEAGIIPSISIGYDTASIDDDNSDKATQEAAQWMIGLNWKDAFIDGNIAGVAFGQRAYATDLVGSTNDPADDNFMWEAYYTFKVSDNITVTPALMGATDPSDAHDDDVFAGLVQTTFRF